MQKTIEGVRLAYDVAGSGGALVLLHGFPLDRSIWDAQFAALARRCQIIRPDLRGSGESACGEGPALMETLAGAFRLTRRARRGTRDHCRPCDRRLRRACFYRMYAERFAGLALIGSHVAADPVDRRPERDALTVAIEARGMDAAIQADLPRAKG